MTGAVLHIIGGVGLFLAGMVILTDGLRAIAGDSLRRILAKYTKSPLSGAVTGAATTALIQSSSATIVTAVGFVGAGMLTFTQSLGIVYGANVGTTLTGWIVAILGFKIKLGTVVLPLVLIGVALRLYGRAHLKHIGWSLVGFSLLFLGISAMQDGAVVFEGTIVPSVFPADTPVGRLQLVMIGVVITVVTQSSSAGVATAMVALGGGAINFPQAAAMVIGMNVGTTFTAVLATIGGSTPMRRTGYAHVIYNVVVGVIAFFLLEPAQLILEIPWLSSAETGGAQLGLALFHSFFNLLGVGLFLPFTKPFAQLVKWLVPTEKARLTELLDKHLLEEAGAATDAVRYTVKQIRDYLFYCLSGILPGHKERHHHPTSAFAEVEVAINETRRYIRQIKVEADSKERHHLVEAMHALDHMHRLLRRCAVSRVIAVGLAKDWRLQRLSGVLHDCLPKVLAAPIDPETLARARKLNRLMKRQSKKVRVWLIQDASSHGPNGKDTLLKLDAMRWLQRVTFHVWRIQKHTKDA